MGQVASWLGFGRSTTDATAAPAATAATAATARPMANEQTPLLLTQTPTVAAEIKGPEWMEESEVVELHYHSSATIFTLMRGLGFWKVAFGFGPHSTPFGTTAQQQQLARRVVVGMTICLKKASAATTQHKSIREPVQAEEVHGQWQGQGQGQEQEQDTKAEPFIAIELSPEATPSEVASLSLPARLTIPMGAEPLWAHAKRKGLRTQSQYRTLFDRWLQQLTRANSNSGGGGAGSWPTPITLRTICYIRVDEYSDW